MFTLDLQCAVDVHYTALFIGRSMSPPAKYVTYLYTYLESFIQACTLGFVFNIVPFLTCTPGEYWCMPSRILDFIIFNVCNTI